MITVNDILTQWNTLKSKVNEYYTLIYNEKNDDATLDDLDSTSKTGEYNLWMHMGAALGSIMDGLWEDRQVQFQAKIDSFIPLPDRWLQRECLAFQYGDTLQWDAEAGKYYYAVIDADKQIIARCAVIRAAGITFVKVAKLDGENPVPLVEAELDAFIAYVNQIQWAGARIATPVSLDADLIKAPMTIYYDGTKPIADIKALVETAYNEYLSNLPFNGEYSKNKHADYIESASADIKEANPGTIEAKVNAGAYAEVVRVYTPAAGYLVRDPSVSYDDLFTYEAQ